MERLKVADIMTVDVVTIGEEESLDLAEQVMRAGRIHHLPVVAFGRVVGLLTHSDILRAQVSSLADLSPAEERDIKRSIAVRLVMSRDVCTIAPTASVLEAAELLRRHKYGCLPVIDGDRLVGIVTEGDFVSLVVRALAERPSVPAAAYAR